MAFKHFDSIIVQILLALCLVGIASCTSRRSPRIIYNSANDSLSESFNASVFLVTPKCPKGTHFVEGRYSGGLRNYRPAKCRENSHSCSDYNNDTANCEKCNFGYKINKDSKNGDHCNMKWWMYILIIVGLIAAIGLIGVLAVAMCKCCKH